ncbi:serine/threonine protein kinase [Pyrobaculum aerophilum]|uniref:serine/threonine protein kinase n=1 Tax=Pyrobaculum aerophilum TaxID=13773 RepID=UPI0026B5194C|nr:serine/threonine protein kinase [Pyrobaculum aerophilum]
MDNITLLLHTIGGGVEHALSVARQLNDLQLILIEGGPLLLNGVWVVGKGTNSVVFKCRPAIGNVELTCKVRRGDASRPTLAPEGQLLQIANTVGVGPRVYTYSRDVIAYFYIDGIPLGKWWASARVEERGAVVEELLRQAFKLDTIGVSHNELSRLEKHVLVERGRPVIIDFESASLGGGNNVTQVANGLMRLA